LIVQFLFLDFVALQGKTQHQTNLRIFVNVIIDK